MVRVGAGRLGIRSRVGDLLGIYPSTQGWYVLKQLVYHEGEHSVAYAMVDEYEKWSEEIEEERDCF
jgi:hypothetical protein